MSADGYAAETWTAMGTRLAGGKRAQAFRDPDGKTRIWGDRASYAIGGSYELAIRRDPDGALFRQGTPRYLGPADGVEPGDLAEWEVKSEAADRKLRSESAERNAKRGGKIDAACVPLCELAASLRSFEDVDRLMTSVRRRLYDAWDKR